MKKGQRLFQELLVDLRKLYYLGSTLQILAWDQEVKMPKKGGKLRSETIECLSGILHEKFTTSSFGTRLRKIKKFSKQQLNDEQQAIVREVLHDYHKAKKEPKAFVELFAKTASQAQNTWREAKQKSDFPLFQPYLTKIVKLARKRANYLGYRTSPYEALLHLFEPALTLTEITALLEELKAFLIPFLKILQRSPVNPNPQRLFGNFPIEKQEKLNQYVAQRIGFDFEAGRLDISEHPFTSGLHPDDVRFTTRYDKEDVLHTLIPTIHEAGHGLYEQGLLAKNFGTPLGEALSIAMHEAQSRLWENIIGRSKIFWQFFYPRLQKIFPKPFRSIPLDDFYAALNTVKASLIRVAADEVTYNLHIILRFEIEKELMEGALAVSNLPRVWNERMKSYLGVRVPDNAHGVLQDIHWSFGSIGYFPSYALGNIYAAQLYHQAQKDLPNLENDFRRGHFERFLAWQRKHIHRNGRGYRSTELIQAVTGEKISAKYFIDYLRTKYSELYKL